MENFSFLGKNIFQTVIFIMDKSKIRKCMEWVSYFRESKINGCQEYFRMINLLKLLKLEISFKTKTLRVFTT
jgi:hypothetical protein